MTDFRNVDRKRWRLSLEAAKRSFLMKVILPSNREEFDKRDGQIVWCMTTAVGAHFAKQADSWKCLAGILLENPTTYGWRHLREGDPIICYCEPDVRPVGLPNPSLAPYFGEITLEDNIANGKQEM